MKRKQNWVQSKWQVILKIGKGNECVRTFFLNFSALKGLKVVLAYAKELLVGTKSQGEEAGKSQTKD